MAGGDQKRQPDRKNKAVYRWNETERRLILKTDRIRMDGMSEQEHDEYSLTEQDKLTTRTRETTYGSDFWKQQYKTAEIERETLQGQVKNLQTALKESLDHQSRLVVENETEIAFAQEVADKIREARLKLTETLGQLGFSVDDRVAADSNVSVESGAFIKMMDYFVEVQTRRRDRDGLPLTWVGAMSTLEETIIASLEYKYDHLTVKEIGLTNSLKDVLKLVNHYVRYLNNENKKVLMDALADAALSEFAVGEKPRPIFAHPEDNSEDDEDSKNGDSTAEKAEISPMKKQLQKEDDEYFRISNIRLDLEVERRLTRDLKLELANAERDLENALVKLDAEKKRMDDLNTRDEANETKFASLQKTLDMLVNGETKKTMDTEKSREMGLELSGMRRQLDAFNKQVELSNKRASDAERRLEVMLKNEAQLKSELAGLDMNLSLKIDKKRAKVQMLSERVTDLENVSTELYAQLQDALMVSSRLEKDNNALRMQIESLRGGELSGAWMREKLETQIGRSKALEDALYEMRKQLSAEQNEMIIQGEAYLRLEKQLVEQKEQTAGIQSDYDRQKNRGDMLERDNRNLDAMLIVAKEKVAYLNRRIIDIQGNVRVLCRVRPVSPAEKRRLELTDKQIQAMAKFPDYNTMEFNSNPFEFDRVFPPSTTQRNLFDEVESIVRSVMTGVKGSIFVYGQTGAGKTYTMEGLGGGEESNPDRGLVYRSFEVIFDISQMDIEVKTDIEMSMMEVYNERIRDLLNRTAHQDQTLEVRLAKFGVVVENLGLWPVANLTEAVSLFESGTSARRVSSTDDNEFSSRSHLVTVVRVNRHNMRTGEKFAGVLHLVDLAGSEKVKMSSASGTRLREAQHINKSLGSLADVITALATKQRQIPYRNSKLTFLLQDVLKENSKVVMITCVNPIPDNLYESISTLTFGLKCRNVILGHARREGVTYDTYHESVGRVEENSLESSFHMPQLARTR